MRLKNIQLYHIMWLILLSLICIYLMHQQFGTRYYTEKNLAKTYNREYSELYDTIWYDEDRYKSEVAYISRNIDGKKPNTILDLGCGTGNHIKWWKEMWPDSIVTGMDISPEQLSVAREKHSHVDIIRGSYLENGVWENDKFDMIVCMYAAGQYTDATHVLFRNVYKWLKPGGIFVFHGLDPDRLYDGCDKTGGFAALPTKSDQNDRCYIRFPGLVYSGWWSKKNTFSNWMRYNETFQKSDGTEWPLNWDVSNKVGDTVPLGLTKYRDLTTNAHSLYLLPPSRIIQIGREIGFTDAKKNPSTGIKDWGDHGTEEYFIFFEK